MCVLLASLVAPAAWAQAYPVKPIRFIVPFPPGGPTDICGRTAAKGISEALGQPVVVENRPGAGGMIGTESIAKAPADGYTIGVATISALSVGPHVFAKMPFDPVRDIAPITNLCLTIGALVAHPGLPASNVADLVAHAKANPGKLAYASTGVGTIVHLGMEHFAQRAGIQLNHVPYKGAAPAMADLLAGTVTLSADSSLVAAAAHVKGGKLKLIAVTSAKRSPLFPDTPTVAESGYPGFDVSAWFGLVGPGGLPREIVARLNGAAVKALREKDAAERLAALGAEIVADTPEQFAKTISDGIARWGPVVKATGLKPE
ncbi:MAG: Bug family tripartite tricarboxylate transporter substrate binding protein [Burkholderiales bacterium]